MNYAFYDQPEQHLTKRGNHLQTGAGGAASGKKSPQQAAPTQPAWTQDLQRLYSQVVEEELPDDLAKLLEQLDRAADGD